MVLMLPLAPISAVSALITAFTCVAFGAEASCAVAAVVVTPTEIFTWSGLMVIDAVPTAWTLRAIGVCANRSGVSANRITTLNILLLSAGSGRRPIHTDARVLGRAPALARCGLPGQFVPVRLLSVGHVTAIALRVHEREFVARA